MKVVIGIIVVLLLSVFAIALYPVALVGIMLYQFFIARKEIRKIEGDKSPFEKYKLISRPFMFVGGFLLALASGICFSLRPEGAVGILYFLIFIVGVFMSTVYSMKKSHLDSEPRKFNGILYKVVPSAAALVMCAVMAVRIANYTPPVAVASASPQDAVSSTTGKFVGTTTATFRADSETESTPQPSAAQTISQTTQTSTAPTISPAAQSPATQTTTETSKSNVTVASSVERGGSAVKKTAPSIVEPSTTKTQESESAPIASAALFGGGNGVVSDSGTHFDDYDTPEQQKTIHFVLNTATMKVHEPHCSDVRRIKPDNYSTIESLADALNNGYELCKRCDPNE